MSVVAITSSRTSPGATSLAAGLAIAWSHLTDKALLIEADPAGGVLALRFELAPSPSLTTFASDVRNTFASELVWANTQDLRGVHCMPAPVDPRLARSWIERVAPTLIAEVPKLGAPTVIDLGWVDENGASASLTKAADTTLIVTSPDIAEIQGLLFQIRRLQDEGANVALVTVGDKPNDPQEVAAIAGIPLAAVLPHDPAVAAALTGGTFKPAKFRRSLLWRTISGLAANLFDEQLMASRAASLQYPAPTGLPTYPVAVAQSVSDPIIQIAPAAEWAPGTLDELTPQSLANNQPLPSPMTELSSPDPVASLVMPDATSVAGAPMVVATYSPPTESASAGLPAATTSPTAPGNHEADPGLFDETKRLPHRVVASLLLPQGTSQELAIDDAAIIGRHRDCAVSLNDSQVSRRHGRITCTANGWHYADLGSRNGTSLNGQPCTDALLTSGDVLTIGRTQLTFQTTSIREMECA